MLYVLALDVFRAYEKTNLEDARYTFSLLRWKALEVRSDEAYPLNYLECRFGINGC